jgi:HSP20 family protein
MSQLAKPTERTAAETQARPTSFAVPRATIREEKDGYLLDLEMPGVRKDGLEITVENNELTLIGRRSDPELKGEAVYRESRPLDYRRVFDLDPSIDAGKITAKMEQGIVTLSLPKAESVKPRKIVVGD